MQLLLIRHAVAEKREDWNELGHPDNIRPLAKKGLIRFADTVSGLARFVPKVDHIYSSQMTRAIQTAEMVHGHYQGSKYNIIPELNPGHSYKELKKILNSCSADDVIALVGHQPDLSSLCSHLLGSKEDLLLRFKKGGVALLSYRDETAQLQWLLTQRQLAYLSLIK